MSFANVAATLAVFLALTGGATAAALITGKDVKDGSLTGADVKNHSLLRKDFKSGQLPAGARGPQGVAGPTGPTGPQGPKGDSGTVDTSGFLRASVTTERHSEPLSIPPFTTHAVRATCPDDGLALRGVYSAPGDWTSNNVAATYEHSAYVVTITNSTGSTEMGSAQLAVTCMNTPPPSLNP